MSEFSTSNGINTVYAYRFDGRRWRPEWDVCGSGSEEFGRGIAIEGGVIAVGAPGDGSSPGEVHVYRWINGGWTTLTAITASNGANGDRFGWTVDVCGDLIVVGAPDSIPPQYAGNGWDTGSVYVFRYDGSSWIEEAQLAPSNGSDANEFHYGNSVAVDGDTLAVGAPHDSSTGHTGFAYVYRYRGVASGWVQEGLFNGAPNVEPDSVFGVRVAVDGDVLLVGAIGDFESGLRTGSAWVYRYDGAGWIQEAKLLASDQRESGDYGRPLAVCGDTILVGAWVDDEEEVDSGAVYLYRYDGANWNEANKFKASDADEGDNFGALGIGLSGDVAIIGAMKDDEAGKDAGAMYVFRLRGPTALTSVTPSTGPTSGGNTVTLVGEGFDDLTEVFFGRVRAESVTFDDSTQLTVVVPPVDWKRPPRKGRLAGSVNVSVAFGSCRQTIRQGYRYN